MKYKLLMYKPMKFTNSDTGEMVEMAKVALMSEKELTGDNRGRQVDVISLLGEAYKSLESQIATINLPVDVSVEFEVNLNGKSKVTGVKVIK
jgi:hypothetical protein